MACGTKTGRATDEYRKAFWNGMRNKVLSYEVQNALTIGTDSEGGYLVPDEYEKKLVEALEEEVFFRNLATVIKTSSGDRKIPIVTSKGEAAWIDEGGQFPESDDSFGQTTISAFKLATMIKVSDELLNDSVFNIEQYISREFGRRIGTKEEEAFFIGDGKGKPTGIFNATGGAETGVTSTGTSITFDDVMDLYYSLRAPYRNKAVWLLNDSTVKAIRKLKDGIENLIRLSFPYGRLPDIISVSVLQLSDCLYSRIIQKPYRLVTVRGTEGIVKIHDIIKRNGCSGGCHARLSTACCIEDSGRLSLAVTDKECLLFLCTDPSSELP